MKLFPWIFKTDFKGNKIEDTPEPDTNPEKPFQNLTLFDKYMFAKSYIRLLKIQLDRSRKQNRVLQDEIIHLKTLFRKDKRLPK